MAVSKPVGEGRIEQVPLDKAAQHMLEECRMVLPGIQALFGFQLIAVFNEGFGEKLSGPQQLMHLAAIILVAIAIALVMAPAALHRQTEPQEVSERFVWLSSNLLLASMYPLAIAICLDAWLVTSIIVGRNDVGIAVAFLLLAVFALFWLLLPRRETRPHP
jgi:hypothetical protein